MPRYHLAVIEFTVASPNLAQLDPGSTRRGRSLVHIVTLGSPGNEAWGGEIVQAKPAGMRRRRLARVRSDQLEVHARSNANERVPSAFAGMAPAWHGANPRPKLKALNLLLEVLSCPHEVVD